MHCFSADVVDFSVPVPSVQKNSGNIGAMQWPPESQLSLNVSRVYAKHSVSLSTAATRRRPELLWWTLTGPWPGSCEPVDLPSIHFSPFHVATCEIDLCAATVHAFLVKIPEPLTRTLDWLAGGLEREDDMGDGEPAAGRFPLSPCLVHFRQFSSDPAPPS